MCIYDIYQTLHSCEEYFVVVSVCLNMLCRFYSDIFWHHTARNDSDKTIFIKDVLNAYAYIFRIWPCQTSPLGLVAFCWDLLLRVVSHHIHVVVCVVSYKYTQNLFCLKHHKLSCPIQLKLYDLLLPLGSKPL